MRWIWRSKRANVPYECDPQHWGARNGVSKTREPLRRGSTVALLSPSTPGKTHYSIIRRWRVEAPQGALALHDTIANGLHMRAVDRGAHPIALVPGGMMKRVRVAVVDSHPIQYFAPLYAYLNRDP